MKICPKCGMQNDDNSVVCTQCGYLFGNENIPQNAQTVYQQPVYAQQTPVYGQPAIQKNNGMKNIRVYRTHENYLKLRKIVYYILGVLEALFAFRLIFKLLGANPGSGFVSLIYTISGVFMAPFSGIFRAAVTNGIETKSVLEPATIIAMIVYALIAYGVIRLIKIYATPKDKEIL
jgi:hypothetical protein